MLELKNVTISYGDRPVVKDFSMMLKKGEIVSLVGESGFRKNYGDSRGAWLASGRRAE